MWLHRVTSSAGTVATRLPGQADRARRAHIARLATLTLLVASGHAAAQGDPAQGFRIMLGNQGNCVACHALPGQQDIPSNFAPTLDKVGLRHDAATLRQWVADARILNPGTLMPPFGTTAGTKLAIRPQGMLTPEQLDHVVAALVTLR
jgi:L-cysteine S-thiosulfotransferase